MHHSVQVRFPVKVKKIKTMGDTSMVFAAHAAHLTYAPVGTGETYFAAFAALNLLVSLETFLEAALKQVEFQILDVKKHNADYKVFVEVSAVRRESLCMSKENTTL